MQAKREQIIIVAGRSGGHILPGISLAKQYKRDNPTAEITFISTARSLDKEIMSNESIIDHKKTIAVGNVPSRFYKYPFFLIKILAATIKSIASMVRQRPTKVILMGGHISIPFACAAWLLRIPRELYELNAVPGKAAKFIAPFASRICLSFVGAKKYFKSHKSVVVPYPIRFDPECRSIMKNKACEQLNLDPSRKTIFIMGGSQGSVFINNAIKAAMLSAPSLIGHVQVIHQTGSADTADWTHWYKQRGIPAIVFAYHHDLSRHYVASDVIIGRAGAGMIFEILFFQKQALLIPLETADNNHQLHNAQAAQQSYGNLITVMRQADIERNKQLLPLALTNLIMQDPQGSSESTINQSGLLH